MDYTYGVPLYEKKDIEKAFMYLHLDDEYGAMPASLFEEFLNVTANERSANITITMANMKKVHDYSFKYIFPYIMNIFKYKGYSNFGFTDVAGLRIAAYNQYIGNQVIEANIARNYWSSDISWFYYTPKANDNFEQVINTKPYRNCITRSHGDIYIQLCPSSDFSLIYDFYDDICKYL